MTMTLPSCKLSLSAGLIALGLLLAMPSVAAIENDVHDFYQKGTEKFVKKLEDFHLLRSQKKSSSGQAAFAWAELATILHYVPNHPVALERLSALSKTLHRSEQTIGYFEKAIHLFPNDDKTLSLYAAFLNSIHEHTAALEQSKRALHLAPTNTVALNQLGLAYYGLKDFKMATEAADKAKHLGALSEELREELHRLSLS